MKCPECGKQLSCLAGCSSHPLNWYCKGCDYRTWHKDKDSGKPDCKYIYLTGATAGWDEPHWCADRITDDDIEYIRTDAILPRWIPVDERLPEKKCIATYLNSHDKHRTIIAVYVPRFTVESSGEADDYDEYLANTDMYYFKEGWYECQENWGEYAMIYVNEGDVSHWMPLPPPPQENEDVA